jgi:anti-sigma-K factor RskA
MLAAVPQVTPPARALESLLGAIREDAPFIMVEPRRSPRRWGLLIAAAVLLLVTNALWWLWAQTQIDDTGRLDDNVQWVTFTPLIDDGAPSIVVIWDVRTGTATLYSEDLPPIDADQSYQLWLQRGDERISAGVFQQDADGRGVLVFDPPAPLGTYTGMGITPEPLGGSPAPTSSPVATVEL